MGPSCVVNVAPLFGTKLWEVLQIMDAPKGQVCITSQFLSMRHGGWTKPTSALAAKIPDTPATSLKSLQDFLIAWQALLRVLIFKNIVGR